jgi:hypothetical protein
MFIIPDTARKITLHEFKYTAPPAGSEWDFPSWQLPVHLKFLKIYTNRWLETMAKVNTLNYLIKFYAFLQVYCSGWSHDTGGECNYLVGDYVALTCRDMERQARDHNIYFYTWPSIPLGNISKSVCFTEMISGDIYRNEQEREAKSKGFDSHKDFWRYQLEEMRKQYGLEKEDKE